MQTEWQTVQTLIRGGAVWSGSALFAQAYLSENVGSLRRNFPKFSDRQVWANSADPDQTAVWSGSTLFAIPSASIGLITLL